MSRSPYCNKVIANFGEKKRRKLYDDESDNNTELTDRIIIR